MATLTGQTIASSYEQLLALPDGGGNSTTHVAVTDGDGGTTFPITLATDAIMITSTNRLEFGDDGTYIHQSADGVLDLVSDTTLELNGGSGSMKIDTNSRISLSNNGGEATNTIFGYQAGNSIHASSGMNTFVGHQVADATMTADADENTAVGHLALSGLTSGEKNIAIGSYTGINITSGDENVLIGRSAGNNHNSSDLVAVGTAALASISNATADGTVAVGHNALTALTIGTGNVAIGYTALDAEIGGDKSTAVGYEALTAQTGVTGEVSNTAIGYSAGKAIQAGIKNVIIGSNAAIVAQDVDETVIIGQAACGDGNLTATGTVVIGRLAGYALVGGAGNTLIGYKSGDILTTGDNNTIIGFEADPSANSGTNQIVLGKGVTGSGDGTLTFGHGSTDTTCTNGSTSWSNPSDKRIKKDIQDSSLGLSFINDLKPKTFKYKAKGDLPKIHSEYEKDSSDLWREDKTYHGFIAQEVKEAIDKAGDSVKDGFEGWSVNATTELQRVGESAFIGALIKAVQELTAKVEELESKLT